MCGPKMTGFAGHDRFDRILSAARRQTFADKRDRGDGIPIAKLPRGIDEKAVGPD